MSYRVVVNGVPIECPTPADAIRLANEVAASNGTAHPSDAGLLAPSAIGSDNTQSKWREPAKEVIRRLVEAGASGLGTDRVAEIAGLKTSKGSSPLLKAVITLLDAGEDAIDRPRTADGKRWVLTPRGAKAAAKLGLLPNAEDNRP